VLYEIINLSDPYTIETPDLAIAGVACLLLGEGQYAFKPVDDGPEVPMFAFGGVDGWFEQHCGGPVGEVLPAVRDGRKDELAAAFESVVIGDAADRKRYELARGYVPEPQRGEFRARWHDLTRTSATDIGARAYALAAQLRAGKLKLGQLPAVASALLEGSPRPPTKAGK
jgi:hypothetical protein